MCLFNAPKPPKPPKPQPLPPAFAAPPPPPAAKKAPVQLQAAGAAPDLRIGGQRSTAGRTGRINQSSLKSGLNLGSDSGGLNV
jgi:hypothetical protein|tara:strand:- start:833 stop:1081 length:249 start_codon:yes stop_codon:yes gene_type:complete